MEHILIRVDEAARILAVSRWTIYRWIREGRLEGAKLHKGSLRIFRHSVMALVEANRTSIPGVLDGDREPVARACADTSPQYKDPSPGELFL